MFPFPRETLTVEKDTDGSVMLKIDELLGAEIDRGPAVTGATGADDVGTGFPGELRRH